MELSNPANVDPISFEPVKIKICGFTNQDNLKQICELPIHAVGFNFYRQSKRCVSIDQVLTFQKCVPALIEKVGVFVNPDVDEIFEIKSKLDLDVFQFHGEESAEFIAQFDFAMVSKSIIKSFRWQGPETMNQINEFMDQSRKCKLPLKALLIDAYSPDEHGGTGEAFNWEELAEFSMPGPWMLAGGLGPMNIQKALSTLTPNWVDVASGVESEPGIKDPLKVGELIQSVNQ